MKIVVLFCNIIVPVIMIWIGILYNRHSNEKINKILDLFMPIAMIGSGLGGADNSYFFNDKNSLEYSNKKCGLIWFISGIVTLIITIIVLIIIKLYYFTFKVRTISPEEKKDMEASKGEMA